MAGLSDEDAAVVADNLLQAELRGTSSHGTFPDSGILQPHRPRNDEYQTEYQDFKGNFIGTGG